MNPKESVAGYGILLFLFSPARTHSYVERRVQLPHPEPDPEGLQDPLPQHVAGGFVVAVESTGADGGTKGS